VPHAAKLPVEEIKRRLISIYSIFKTENVSKVDHLLQKYAGQEEFLYQTVCSKYNVDERAFSAAVPPVKSAPPAAPVLSDLGGIHPSAWALPKSAGVPAVLQSPPPQAGPPAVPVAPWSKTSTMQRTAVLHQDVPVQQSDSQPLPVKAHPPDLPTAMPALLHKAPPTVPPQPLQNGNSSTPLSEVKGVESAHAMPAAAALPVKAPPPMAPATQAPQAAESTGGSIEDSALEPSKDLDEDATMNEEQEAFFALVRAASTAEGGLETRKSGGSNPHNTDVSSAAGSPAQDSKVEGSPPLKKQKLAGTTITKSVSESAPDDAPPKPASEPMAQGTSEATKQGGDTATGPGEEVLQNISVDDYDAEDSVLGDDEAAQLQQALWAMHKGADSAVENAQAASVVADNPDETPDWDIVDIDTVLLGERSGFFKSIEEMQAGSAASDEGNASEDSGSSSSDESDENSEGSPAAAEQNKADSHEPQAEDSARLAPAVEKRSEPAVAEAAPPVTSVTAAIPNGSAAELNGAADAPVLKDGYGTDPSSSEGESDSESSDSASADAAKVGATNEEHAQRWRAHVGGQIFAALDRKHAGRLRSGEMLKFARFSGFDGTKEDWSIAYTQLCQDQQCNPKEGLTQEAFLRLISDESDRGCYCSNAELRSICENIAPAALQVMEAPSMGA